MEEDDQISGESETLKQTANNFKHEEEVLLQDLEKLKKENFSLKTSINAWQFILEEKLKEFKEIELKLDMTYNKIWSEREKFCDAADEYNEKCGVLSDWWQTQLSFLSDLEKLKQKRIEHEKCKENIEKLEKELDALKMKVKELNEAKPISVEVEVHLTENENTLFRKESTTKSVVQPQKTLKQVRFAEPEDDIVKFPEDVSPENKLFSLMNVEKVKMAKRNLRHKNSSLEKKKKK